MTMQDESLKALERTLTSFCQRPDWNPEAEAPEDSREWREGYEAALENLREELKPWWPFARSLSLTTLGKADHEG